MIVRHLRTFSARSATSAALVGKAVADPAPGRDGMFAQRHGIARSEQRMQYKHHLETNYCISGSGEVEDLATGQVFPIRPGMVYALDQHDATRGAREDRNALRLCLHPALTGTESHQPDGSYAASVEET